MEEKSAWQDFKDNFMEIWEKPILRDCYTKEQARKYVKELIAHQKKYGKLNGKRGVIGKSLAWMETPVVIGDSSASAHDAEMYAIVVKGMQEARAKREIIAAKAEAKKKGRYVYEEEHIHAYKEDD